MWKCDFNKVNRIIHKNKSSWNVQKLVHAKNLNWLLHKTKPSQNGKFQQWWHKLPWCIINSFSALFYNASKVVSTTSEDVINTYTPAFPHFLDKEIKANFDGVLVNKFSATEINK